MSTRKVLGTLFSDTLWVTDWSLSAQTSPTNSAEVHGGWGNDDLHVYGYHATLYGGDGNDWLASSAGNDRLFGGSGNDTLLARGGNDVVSGGSGNDWIAGDAGSYDVNGGGRDVIDGGSGFDTLDYSAAFGMTFDVSKGTATGRTTDTFKGIEQIYGTWGDDIYKGSSRNDVFFGGKGDDTIRGLGGADTLTGGAGNDTFVWFKKDVGGTNGVDTIRDFQVGDKLDLRDFFKGKAGVDIDDMVHFTETSAGTILSVNVKGTFVDVAHLAGAHNLDASDMLAAGAILA